MSLLEVKNKGISVTQNATLLNLSLHNNNTCTAMIVEKIAVDVSMYSIETNTLMPVAEGMIDEIILLMPHDTVDVCIRLDFNSNLRRVFSEELAMLTEGKRIENIAQCFLSCELNEHFTRIEIPTNQPKPCVEESTE